MHAALLYESEIIEESYKRGPKGISRRKGNKPQQKPIETKKSGSKFINFGLLRSLGGGKK